MPTATIGEDPRLAAADNGAVRQAVFVQSQPYRDDEGFELLGRDARFQRFAVPCFKVDFFPHDQVFSGGLSLRWPRPVR
jgi:hypothetical protein